MATYSQTNIKCNDVQTVATELKKYLRIGREKWFDTRKPWFYNVPHDENSFNGDNLTIVVSKIDSEDWVEVEFDFQFGVYFFDEILKQISKNLNTDILLAYYQSTSGQGRLAKFKNGKLELSYYEKYRYEVTPGNDSYTVESNYVADNFGVSGSDIELLKNTKLGDQSLIIDYDLINEFYKAEGWKGDSGKNIFSDWDYLHLEQLKK
ncbi:hypothetical protein [Flavobacterium notoginsengisoli]|uniref:hypothetical protein n=1 Tax=Flavobacterium notoginsengisoli TaxID=1478199 RepID=UPI00363B2D5D